MTNDPVLSRSMFAGSGVAPTPFPSVGTGITSNVVSPEEGAQQLLQAFPNPLAPTDVGYSHGGSVRHFVEGDVVNADETDAAAAQRQRMQDLDNFNRSYSEKQKTINDKNRSDVIERTKQEEDRLLNTPPGAEGTINIPNKNVDLSELPRAARSVLPPGFLPNVGGPSKPDGANYYEGMAGVDRTAPISSRMGDEEYGPPMPSPEAPTKKGEEQGPPMPTKAGDRDKRAGKGGLDLLLEDIKNRRAASAEEKENNKWLALMQAGFAIMGGRSPHAMQNIGAGALQGSQAYAAFEKDRRAEDRALFGEEAQVRLAQEKMAESADERAAQREMLAARDRERLHERASDRERLERQAGITSINTVAGQTRQELQNIDSAERDMEALRQKYLKDPMLSPDEKKSELDRIDQRKQALDDRRREAIQRHDEVLGRQKMPVPERGPPSLSLPNGGTIRYSGYTPK
jgi:hypothetical protein